MRSTLALILILFFSGPAYAQEEPEPEISEEKEDAAETSDPQKDAVDPVITRDQFRRGLAESDTNEKSREELQKSGYVFDDETLSDTDSTPMVLALTAGILVHGIGHFAAGKTSTGFALVGMELLGIFLSATSIVIYVASDDDAIGNAIATPMFQTGAALFVFSYLADVVGTINGPKAALFDNTHFDVGAGVSASYGFINARGSSVRHALAADLFGEFSWIYANGGTTQDLLLETSIYRGRLGVRPFRSVEGTSSLHLEAGGELFSYSDENAFSKIGFDGRVGFSLDLGELFSTLDDFVVGAEGGVQVNFWQFADFDSETLETQSTTYTIPFDTWMKVNVGKRLWVEGGYGTPSTPFVPAISNLVGVIHAGGGYRTSKLAELFVHGNYGDGASIWLGGKLYFL